jgi:endogenous inhibitor of DNA gyrase (YacG/DUF329 family)
MSCPTCGETMTALGCKVTNDTFYWCPRCGSILPCSESHAVAPALVERCRQLEAKGLQYMNLRDWHKLGIAESINLPAARPAPEPPR